MLLVNTSIRCKYVIPLKLSVREERGEETKYVARAVT